MTENNGGSDSEKKWIMCPVCYEPNPPGNMFCKYCNGNKITRLKPEPLRSIAEIDKLRKEWLVRLRRKKTIRLFMSIFFPTAITALLTIVILFYFTDVLGRPRADVNSASRPGEWTMFGYDLSRTASYGSTGAAPKGVVKWMFAAGDRIQASPVVVNGTVYIGSNDRKLYALDAETGGEIWSFEAKSWIESSAVVVNGIVYVGSNDSRLYALDAESGEKIWEYHAKYGIRSSPAVADGRIYFSSGEYKIYAIDAQTGELLWEFDTWSNILASPVVANGLLYVADTGRYFYVLNAATGRRRLQFRSYGGARSSAAIVGESAYFTNTDGILFCVDGHARNWPNEHGMRNFLLKFYIQSLEVAPPMWLIPPAQSGYLWGMDLEGKTLSSPVATEDTVFVASGNRFLSINQDPLIIDWEFTAGDLIRSSPAIAGGVIYVGCDDGNLYALQSETGDKLWEVATGDKITASPAVVDGIVYIASYDGNVYAIE